MKFYGVNRLRRAVELGVLVTLVIAAGAGLLVLVWMLRGELLGVFLK